MARKRWRSLVTGMCLVLPVVVPAASWGGRCATGLRGDKAGRFETARPLPRRSALRGVAPVPTRNASTFVTDHFRLLWGDAYDRSDPDWADADGNGRPDWVDETASALEYAYQETVDLGFPAPYGVGNYYLDVYFANTGVEVYSTEQGQWVTVTVDSSYYAYTEIDADYGVAYFVFNDDFSQHADDERSVLRATAAHELFHAVQRALGYPWDDEEQVSDTRWRNELWWFEATATWMEEVVTPDVDDYVTYVQRFLSRPEEPLNSQDGLHEYGAAIFPGFLWLRYGATDLWIDVFSNAFDEGLESALRTALDVRQGESLEDAVAAFWSLAAHPEDFWPDGEQFRAPAVPSLARAASTLPLSYTSSPSTAPGRFGANLFRLDRAPETLGVTFTPVNPATARLAVSRAGSSEIEVVDAPEGRTDIRVSGEAPALLAMVNVGESPLDFSLLVEGPDGGGSGGSGGCFVSALGL